MQWHLNQDLSGLRRCGGIAGPIPGALGNPDLVVVVGVAPVKLAGSRSVGPDHFCTRQSGECTDAATGQIQAELPEPRYASSGERRDGSRKMFRESFGRLIPDEPGRLAAPWSAFAFAEPRSRSKPNACPALQLPIIQRRAIAAAGHDQHSAVIRRPHHSRRSLTHQSRWPPGDQVADSTSIGGSTSRRSASARRCISASLDFPNH